MRGTGAIGALQGALPGPALDALAVLTHLGSAPLLVGLLALVFWFRARRAGAHALLVLLGAFGLTLALKAAFALPRPPAATRLIEASGYGFPSGHAIAATVGWGLLAAVLDVGERRERLAVAAVVVGVVALSRVALGVHFVADVVAGVAVGVAYLAAVTRWSGGDPTRAGGVAVAVAASGVVAAGANAETFALAGATVGALAAWWIADPPTTPWRPSEHEGVLPVAGASVLVGGTLLLAVEGVIGAAVAFGLGAVAAAAVVGLPAAVAGLEGL